MAGQVEQAHRRLEIRPHEVGQHADRAAGGDQPHLSGQVGDLEPDVGLEARGTALLHRPLSRRRARGLHDPRAIAQTRDPVGRVVGRQRQPDRVAAERLALEARAMGAGVTRILLGDHQIEPASREFEQPLLGRDLGDLHPQPGLALGEQGERTRQDRLRSGLQDRDAHRRDAGLQ